MTCYTFLESCGTWTKGREYIRKKKPPQHCTALREILQMADDVKSDTMGQFMFKKANLYPNFFCLVLEPRK